MNYEAVLKTILEFCEERDWRQFHNPKDLSAALAIEASELQELFLWKDAKEVEVTAEQKREAIEHEIADVAIYLMELADRMDIDLEKAILNKIEKNRLKYPVERAKGKNLKYDEL